MRLVGRHRWSLLLALPFCFGTAVAYGQSSNQDLGQFQGQGDLGTILLAGSGHFDVSKDRYTVSGSGANLWFGIDDFHYVWRKMSGDVALSADIDFVGEKGNAHRKAVLMIRQSLDAHSIYADVARHGDGLTSLQYRDTIGANTHEIETYGKGPHRVRVEKRGDYVYVSIPDANGNMAPSGAAMRVNIQGDFYVGLGVCSHDENVIETAIFSNVRIEPLSPMTSQPVLHSTLESVIVASTDRRVRYTAPIHLEDPNWTPDGKELIFNQEGTLQHLVLDDGIHPIDSMIPRPTSSTLIPTAPETKINGDHGVSPDGSLIAIGNQDPDGQARIYVVPTAGGTPRRLTRMAPPTFTVGRPMARPSPLPASMATTSTHIQFRLPVAPKLFLRQRATWPSSPQMVTGSTFNRTAPATCRSGACTQMEVDRNNSWSAPRMTGFRTSRPTAE